MITVVGWPRSGTHWMKTMIECALGEELAHAHAYPESVGDQYILMVRDPRDVLASHWRLYERAYPGKQTELGFVESFLEGKGPNQHKWNLGWVAYTGKLLEWNERNPQHTSLVRYERLYEAPGITLARTLVGIGRYDPWRWRISRAVRFTWGRRCDPSDLPVDGNMGRPGKWAVHLAAPTVQAVLAYCGPVMSELGYLGKAPT